MKRAGSRMGHLIQGRGSNQILIVGFAFIVVFGALLLSLPASSAGPGSLSWDEALFTSTSAVTVTGLSVVNSAEDLSRFGQWIVLLLMQVGGVGFVALSILAFELIGRRVTLQERFLAQQTLGGRDMSRAVPLALYVMGITLVMELLGALLLFLRWRGSMAQGEAAYRALFHAVSSYCNAGFDLFSGTDEAVFFGYGGDPYTLGVSALLIVVGGFGVTVLYDLWDFRKRRRLGIHTRLTLLMALVLTVVGAAVVAHDSHLLRLLPAGAGISERLVAGTYTAISARTAGLTIVPIEALEGSTQLVMMLWMFVGGAPASMAGGVSTSTLAVILVVVLATARGDDQTVVYARTIPQETLNKAVAIMTVSSVLVATMTWLLVERGRAEVFAAAFEVVSAFSNTGYSLGVTAELDRVERLLFAFTMFWGRLGPLSVVVALAERAQPSLVSYPEESVLLG